MRRHGWQRPLHKLQIAGMVIYAVLNTCFYTFVGLFLGNKTAEVTITTIFSMAALSVMLLFIRCAAIDPSDRTSSRKKKSSGCSKNPKMIQKIMWKHLLMHWIRRIEKKILRRVIRRKYLDPVTTSDLMEPLLPFPFAFKDDSVAPDFRQNDTSYCTMCYFEVKKHSKHCRTCDRCVEGFDHHCQWLNNCIGKRNYTSFILLMVFVLIMLIVEGGASLAVFIRCFADRRGIERDLQKLLIDCPRWILATISLLLMLVSAYGSVAMGQLFFFHTILIRKGMTTYDYILTMKDSFSTEIDSTDDDSDASSESDFDMPESSGAVTRLIYGEHSNQASSDLSIPLERQPDPSTSSGSTSRFHVSIDPWKLIRISRDKARLASEKTREKLAKEKHEMQPDSMHPLPLETKSGLVLKPEISVVVGQGSAGSSLTGRVSGSPGAFSSPKRFSDSPVHRYRNNFDIRLTEMSRDLEAYISRQILCSVIKSNCESSPS